MANWGRQWSSYYIRIGQNNVLKSSKWFHLVLVAVKRFHMDPQSDPHDSKQVHMVHIIPHGSVDFSCDSQSKLF